MGTTNSGSSTGFISTRALRIDSSSLKYISSSPLKIKFSPIMDELPDTFPANAKSKSAAVDGEEFLQV